MIEFQSILSYANQYWEVLLAFFFIALIYASVGFGGGSSYLALLSFTALSFIHIRSTVLICNVIVVTGSTILFIKENELNFKKVIPLVVASIPMSFIGGYMKIQKDFFFVLLGVTLVLSAVFMWFSYTKITTETFKKHSNLKSVLYGGSIGLLSGMVGIGGGIFLAPLLHLTQWDTAKKIAATASFFILVNSISGLVGQYQQPDFTFDWNFLILVLPIVWLGGQIGARTNLKFLSQQAVRRITVFVIAYAGLRILADHFLK